MSYYDPWAHALVLIFHRVVLFVVISIVLSVVLWCVLLEHFFGSTTLVALGGIWDIVQGNADLTNNLLFSLMVSSSTLFTTTVFALLMRSGRLRRGDAHRRGTRVIDNNDKNP